MTVEARFAEAALNGQHKNQSPAMIPGIYVSITTLKPVVSLNTAGWIVPSARNVPMGLNATMSSYSQTTNVTPSRNANVTHEEFKAPAQLALTVARANVLVASAAQVKFETIVNA